MIIIPQTQTPHGTFDAPVETWDENLPSPWSPERLRAFQFKINAIAGLAFNGKPNVRVIWPAWPVSQIVTVDQEPQDILDPAESITMHWVRTGDGRFKKMGRYRLFTQEYELSGINPETGLPVTVFADVDICVRRFIFEQYHVPGEQAFNYKVGAGGAGFYSHLWSVAVHSQDCCNGNEAFKGHLCLGAYREPADRDLEELQRRITIRDAMLHGHMPGHLFTQGELDADARAQKTAMEREHAERVAAYKMGLMSSFNAHGWRMFTDDPSRLKEGKYFDPSRRKQG